uniref:TATA-box binding protein associated factor 4 n=1 Tax=Echeneis naucrates TaxID=173247 RepID=A0A665VNL7_ECHNA
MAAGSDLLDDVFLNTELDGKVVSDLVGCPESELTGAGGVHSYVSAQSTANDVGSSATGGNSNVQGSKMGLSQQELAKARKIAPKSATTCEVVTVGPEAASFAGKPGTTDVQTLNGGSAAMDCRITGGLSAESDSPPAVTLLNNGPVPASKDSAAASAATPNTVPRSSAAETFPGTSSPPSVKTTVALVRPPTQTSPSGGNPAGPPVNKVDLTKTVLQTGVAAGPTVTLRTPTVLQNLRTSVASPIAASPGGMRAIAPQVLAPRLTQPQQNSPNIQNIQLPTGMVLVRSESGQLLMIHQQTLAQMQAKSQSQSTMTPQPAAPTSTPPVHVTSLQSPGGLLARSVTPTTIIKQTSVVPTTVTPTTKLQRPPVLQVTALHVYMFAHLMPSVRYTGVKHTMAVKIARCACKTILYKSVITVPSKDIPPYMPSLKPRFFSFCPQRSLPALRQMTPDSEAFIQQSLLIQPNIQPAVTASTALTTVVLQPPHSSATMTVNNTVTTKTTVISLPPTLHSKPGLIISQQQGTVVRPQVTLAQSPIVTLRGQPQSRIIVGQPQVVKQLQTVPALKQTVIPGAKAVQIVSQSALTAAQKNKLKEAGSGTFRSVIHSDQCRINISAQIIGKKFGVSELGIDVITYISHATQHRLQNLLEKVSKVAQQKNITLKDERHEQVSDVRAQLKFFEQLDHMEKQRKEEQEREILLKAAKSRSRQEDPEQLRLKQKAKEMQQQELAQIRQREANLTALAAIGPRKKRKMNSPVRGDSAEGSGSGPFQAGASSGAGSRQFMRQRITRVNLRDLLFCLENERGTSHSHLLYKGFLK